MAVMTFEEWLNYKALVLGGAPAWFENSAECERRYASYREAFEGNCSAANTQDAVFTPTIPAAHVVDADQTVRSHRVRGAAPMVARLWTIAFALLVQLVVIAAPALAGGQDIVVNGKSLAARDRVSLEAIVGPLEPGAYWARENGDFGKVGSEAPSANIRALVQQRLQAARLLWQRQMQQRQQQALRNQMMGQLLQNAWRQRQAQAGYTYGNNFSSGERSNNGSWSHYNGYSNYGVGGTGDGCIYTPNWSNC
jgi:hypothetical protein